MTELENETNPGAWGDLLTNIISGKNIEKEEKSSSESENEESDHKSEASSEEGVVNIEKEEKAKKLKKKQEENAYSSDEDETTISKKNDRLRKHRDWEMIGRVLHPEMNSAKEKRLRRNARIGVVQLFTAVRAHQTNLKRKQKGGNIQQRTTRIDETRDDFEHLLKKKKSKDNEGEGKSVTTESKWSALKGDEAGEEDDWMD